MGKQSNAGWGFQDYSVYSHVQGAVLQGSGLGYHCERDLSLEGLSGGNRWHADHLETGWCLGILSSEARMRFFIEEIATYTDWTMPGSQLLAQEGLRERVSVALKAASEWKPQEAKQLLALREQHGFWSERRGS